jgi:hypothetical protein
MDKNSRQTKRKQMHLQKTFAKKTEEVVSKVKIKENEVYYGKRKISQSHEEDWLTKELVEKTLKELKPKRCFGFDRVSLVFLKDGASELLMFKILEEEKTPEQWKVARIIASF